MAEPEEMEEDLFADLYDGDDAPETKHNASHVPEPTASYAKAVDQKEEPGYGEEPDTAAPPVSFEDETGNNEAYNDDSGGFDAEGEKHHVTSARDEPLQMKEDG